MQYAKCNAKWIKWESIVNYEIKLITFELVIIDVCQIYVKKIVWSESFVTDGCGLPEYWIISPHFATTYESV